MKKPVKSAARQKRLHLANQRTAFSVSKVNQRAPYMQPEAKPMTYAELDRFFAEMTRGQRRLQTLFLP